MADRLHAAFAGGAFIAAVAGLVLSIWGLSWAIWLAFAGLIGLVLAAIADDWLRRREVRRWLRGGGE